VIFVIICKSCSIFYVVIFLIFRSWVSSPFYFVLVCAAATSGVSLVESSVDFMLTRSVLPLARLCDLFL
jgi:hypothetical protein